jgi:chorismate dehydratase
LRPRVGHIQFLNCLPLYYGLVKNHVLLDIELVKGTPTELNRLLIVGELDISPISSIEYARNHRSLLLFPDFTVSSDGEAKSILLVSKRPVEELSGRRIALTNTSATSQVLLKIILERNYSVKPEYFSCPPDLGKMLFEAEAALLIGDEALRCHCKSVLEKGDLFLYDLGEEWKKLTGKGMVFAVWAVNRSFAEQCSDLSRHVFNLFRKSMIYSREHLDEIAEHAVRWEPFSSPFLRDYFKTLRFDFGPVYQEGLALFYKMAEELRELKEAPELEFAKIRAEVPA